MIRVDVTAQQVLHLGVRPDTGWLTDTHQFVPGSVLRGALAATWLAQHRPPGPDTSNDEEFQRIFEGSVRFGPLYPSDDALRPLSVFGCKYPIDPCRDYAHDAAFDGPAPAVCPRCEDSPTEASKGGVAGARFVEHTHVQLDNLERAMEGQLFTRRALRAGTRLTGLIDPAAQDLGWLTEGEWPVRLGGRRSTAGLAVLTASAEPPAEPFSGWLPASRRLVVRLLSPGIFVDAFGRPSWLPDLAAVGELLGVETSFDAVFARPAMVTGWHAVSNLPKPRDFAVAAGSVFVLGFDSGLPDQDALRRLWRTGLGLRRAEGNGWVSLRRWVPPAAPDPEPATARSAVDRLFLDALAHGIAPLIKDDLRSWAQERKVGSASQAAHTEALLDKPRYQSLAPDAAAVFRASLELSPDDTAALARRLEDWVRTSTSRMGRRVP